MIRKLESTKDYVTLELDNGVTVSVDVNAVYLHLHFSGIQGNITASPFYHYKDPLVQALAAPNFIDIGYTPRKKD